jgi:hypothetical protein
MVKPVRNLVTHGSLTRTHPRVSLGGMLCLTTPYPYDAPKLNAQSGLNHTYP